MELLSLHYFLVTAEEMHITRAAQRLFVTQQCLSSHIQRLEKYYGVALFERKPRLSLTYAGERLVETAQQILAQNNTYIQELNLSSENTKGSLVIGMSHERAKIFLRDVAPQFKKLYPDVKLIMRGGQNTVFEERIVQEHMDMYIGHKPFNQQEITYVKLLKERYYLIVPDHILKEYFSKEYPSCITAFSRGVTIKQMAKLPFVLNTSSHRFRSMLENLISKQDIALNIFLEISDYSPVSLGQNGVGACFCPEMMYAGILNDPNLSRNYHVFPLLDEFSPVEIVLAYRRGRQLPRYAQDFKKMARQTFLSYQILDSPNN